MGKTSLKLTRKQIVEAMWLRGDISYKLHAAQKIIDDAFKKITGQLFVGNCSRQWGKSYWAVTKATECALSKPKARIKYGTAFLTDLEEFIIPTFEEVLKDCPAHLRPVFKTKGSKWVFPNGSEIKLVGLDKKPNGLRGNVIDLIVLDECGFIAKLGNLYKRVVIPATLHRPNCKIIMISTPPDTPDHPFSAFIERAEDEGAYVKLDIYTNPRITPADIERMAKEMGGFDSIEFRRECLCELIIDTTLAILPEWMECAAFTVIKDPAPLPPFYKPIVAIDLALSDGLGVVFGYWDFDRARAVVQEELLFHGVNSAVLTEKCLEVEKRLWGDPKDTGVTPMRWADGALYTINDICSVHKYAIAPVRKDVVEAQVNSLRLMLRGRQVEIYERCKKTIRQCAGGLWNRTKTEFARSETGHQDLLAALIYMVRHLNKENPYPKDYGYRRDDMHYRPKPQQPHHAGLARVFGPKR